MVSDERVIDRIIENDGMFLEGEEAWFVDRIENILYKWNLESEACSFVAAIPIQRKNGYRNNPICLKCGDEIFLFPDTGTCIWIYNAVMNNFVSISVNNPNHIRIGATSCFQDGGTIWTVALGLKEIWEINIAEKRITGIYKIWDDMGLECGDSVERAGDKLYIVAANRGVLCEFCISTRRLQYVEIRGMDNGINTVCFDGERLWFSGRGRKLTGLKRDTGDFTDIIIPSCYIKNNGCSDNSKKVETMLFHQSLFDGKRIWFFPLNLEKSLFICEKIIYIDLSDYEIKELELKQLEEGKGGFFSAYMVKKKCINISSVEGDKILFTDLGLTTMNLTEKHMYRTYQDISRSIFEKMLKRENVEERFELELEAFIEKCDVKLEKKNKDRKTDDIGYHIHKYSIEDVCEE